MSIIKEKLNRKGDFYHPAFIFNPILDMGYTFSIKKSKACTKHA